MWRTLLLGVLVPCAAFGQSNWQDGGMPWQTVGIRQVYSDELRDSLSVIGQITLDNNYAEPVIGSYANGAWNVATRVSGLAYTILYYGDTLLIGGTLTGVGATPVSKVAAFYGGSWHSFGTFGDEQAQGGGIRKLKLIDGVLYAVGGFQYADGQLCNGITKRENGQWVNVGSLTDVSSEPILVDVIGYQGEIYATGAISLAPNGENGIIRFDGSTWTAPGGGIRGGVAGGLCMAVFNEELYVGGSIYRNAGNVGHMIMRWNGAEWNSVGGHLRDQNNDTIGAARCYALLPYRDKLLVAGGFWYAGGIPASRFAIWDGIRWCGTGDEWEGYGESLTLFDDTLFMASGNEVNGMPVNRVAKWVGGPIEGSVCTMVGVPEDLAGQNVPSVYPNPGHGLFTLSAPGLAKTPYRIVDPLGRVVSQGLLGPQGVTQLDLEHAAAGLYNVILEPVKGGVLGVKFIIQ